MPTVYYRAVSLAELAGWRQCGRFRAGPNSCEGKHLATTPDHARRWGQVFFAPGPFAVLRVTVEDSVTAGFERWDRLDGIGPAAFATIEQLSAVVVEEVSHES